MPKSIEERIKALQAQADAIKKRTELQKTIKTARQQLAAMRKNGHKR